MDRSQDLKTTRFERWEKRWTLHLQKGIITGEYIGQIVVSTTETMFEVLTTQQQMN